MGTRLELQGRADPRAGPEPGRSASTILEPQPRGVAQLAEHRSPKPGVAGSSPAAPVALLGVATYSPGARPAVARRAGPCGSPPEVSQRERSVSDLCEDSGRHRS